MQKKKGISLVTLVITIIIMIILAGVIILSLSNSNIFDRASEAVDGYNLKQVQSLASLKWLDAYYDTNVNTEKEYEDYIKEELEKEGIDVRVIDIHTIKPIDKDIIIKSANETEKLISIEDHSIIGGLGSAISEVLTENYPTKLERLGINDTFGKSGKAEELMKCFHITAEDIINKF